MNLSIGVNSSDPAISPVLPSDVAVSDGPLTSGVVATYWMYTEAFHSTFAYAAPVILIFGTVGNIISWFVFQTKNLTGNVTTFYYRSLVVSDLLILHIGLWPRIIFAYLRLDLLSYSVYSCKILNYALFYFLNFEIWAHVMITFERVLGVYHPHKVMAKWTKGFAWRTLWLIAAISAVVTLPVPFIYNVENQGGDAVCDVLSSSPWTQAAVWFEFCIYSVIPIILIPSGNIAINRVVFGGRMESASQVKALSSMSFIFGWLITSFCIVATPSSVVRLASLYTTFDPLVHVVTYFLLFVHSANKIVIFRSICPRYTQEFNIMFCIEKRPPPASSLSKKALTTADKSRSSVKGDSSTEVQQVSCEQGGKV